MAKQMGVQFDAAAIKAAGGMEQFLTSLSGDITRYARATGMLEEEIYGKLFGSAEALRALTPMTGELASKYVSNVGAMKDSTGAAIEAFHQMAETGNASAQLLENRIRNMTEGLSHMASNFQPVLSGISTMGQMAMELTFLVNGIKAVRDAHIAAAIATKATTLATYAQTAAVKVCAAVEGVWAVSTRLLRDAQIGLALGMNTAAAAAGALGIAIRGLMIATGVGVAIAALTVIILALAGKSDAAAESQKNLAKATEQANAVAEAGKQAYQDAAAALDLHLAKLKNFKGGKEEEKRIVSELNNTYGTTMGYFSSVADWYRALTANSETYCRQLVIEAQTRKLANQIAEEKAKQDEIRFTTDDKGNKTLRRYSTKRETETVEDTEKTAMNGGMPAYTRREVIGSSEQEKATREWANSVSRERNLTKQMNNLVRESNSLTMPVVGSPTPPTVPVVTDPKTTNKTGKSGGSTTATDKTEPLMGSVDYYQAELDELRKKITAAADETTARTLQETYKQKEAQLQQLKIRIGLEEPKTEEAKTYMESLQERLTEAKKTFDNAVTVEAKVEANAQVEAIQAEINEATYGRLRIPAEVEPSYIEQGSVTDKRESYNNAQTKASRIQQDYEIGIIGKDEAMRQLVELNAVLFQMGLEPVHIEVETEDVDLAKKKFDATTDAIAAVGSSFSGLGDALELPELNIAGTVAQAVATMAAGYATATAQAAELGPIGWIAFAATGLAQLTAMIQSIKKVTAFAQGGVVSGPTLALVGEYAGASNNPEVVAPLDKLRSMMQPVGGVGGNVRFEIEGRKLVGVLGNETTISGKSGRRNNF
jgi:hypothetical protein